MILVYGVFFLLLFLYTQKKEMKNAKKFFCISIGILLFAIYALKDINIFGNNTGDLIVYVNTYKMLPNRTYVDLFRQWMDGGLKDFLFFAVAKLFADLGVPPEIWIACLGTFFSALFCAFIYRFSDQPLISLLLMLALFFSFTLTGLRQAMAMAILFFAYRFMLEKKLSHFIIAVIIASLFHSTAIIFLPAYFIAKLRLGWKQFVAIAIALVVALAFPSLFVNTIEWLGFSEGYDDTLNWSGYIIQLFMLVFCAFSLSDLSKDLPEEKRYRIQALINCMTVGLCFQGFAIIVGEAFRMSMYYSIGCTAAIPNIIAWRTDSKNRFLWYFTVGSALLLYMLYIRAYSNIHFFWQV